MEYIELSTVLSFWKNSSVKRKRIFSLFFIFVLSVMATLAGTLVPLSEEDASILSSQTSQLLEANTDLASLSSAIFVNNFRLCLLMFIPVFGFVFGLFVLFSTGIALNAVSMGQELLPGVPLTPIIALLALMITPIFWIEFATYSLGMAESVWVFRRLTQKRWYYLRWTAIFIGISAGLLAVGAVAEAWMILFM